MYACKFEGCFKTSHSLGLCGSHYQQHRKGKALKPLQVQHHGMSEPDRFLKRVVMPDDPKGCWLWTGNRRRREDRPSKLWHGQWRSGDGIPEPTHRAAWRMFVGPIPDRACVLHRCDNPICVNPMHLFLGTQSDNAHDMWQKGRANPVASRGENHGMSKLKEDQIRAIRASTKSGPALAKEFNCSTSSIYDIKNFKIWKDVK